MTLSLNQELKFYLKTIVGLSVIGFITVKFIKLIYIELINMFGDIHYKINIFSDYSKIDHSKLLSPLIIAPLIETFILQLMIFRLFENNKNRNVLFIIVSSVLFCFYHVALLNKNFPIYTALYSLLMGMVFAKCFSLIYTNAENKNYHRNKYYFLAYSSTVVCHSIYNLLVTFI